MSRSSQLLFAAVLATATMAAHAQAVQTGGTLVVVPASGELVVPNDEARATLNVEEQDKDKGAAASRVNKKMKQGIEIVKKQDPQAQLKTRGYYTYAVYSEEAPRSNNKPRTIVGWRVGQYLEVTTTNLDGLPKTVAATQNILGLNNLQFGLSPATSKKLDADLINATYKNLNERISSIATAMGRRSSDAVVETVDFEGSGNYVQAAAAPKAMMMRAMADAPQEAVAEPSFEPGESTVGMHLVGKVRFK
ncbi:putative periplasmic/secreted protein [Herbaspirillum sp. CF444]|uniref:SIMPL domain-containing protein n=1 Tax=Herbaspirillum sp. CF444 TaxID=1144319 RepID=UPI0002722DBF|nr:SIMPL domain-containing protein [Herbaspirillum sp. CF444]EJL85195.1 putative periplasmic/secreted protein [Herbaspirillum sp. CF444]